MSLRRCCFSVVLVCSLFTALCVPAISQSKRSKRKTPPGPVRTELKVSPSERLGKIGKAFASYDADSNQTLVGFTLPVLSVTEGDLADLSVGFVVSGKQLTRPDVVKFRLKTYGRPKHIVKGRTALEFRAAGKVFKVENVKMQRHSFDDIYEQFASGDLLFAQFDQIAGSDQIEVRSGLLRFVLRESDREAMRDLLKAAAGASFDK